MSNSRTTFAIVLLCAHSAARADDLAPASEDQLREEALLDENTNEREQFLESRLKAGVRRSLLWQVGWASGYGVGLLTQTTRAVIETQTSAQADLVISSAKAAIGVVSRLLRPPSAMFGTRELDGLPSSTPSERLAKLVRAEAMLRRNAKECDQRYSWVAHTVAIGLNLVGGLIVWLGYHDLTTAATSAGIGIAVGELQIWSQPWRPKQDWKAYQQRFGGATSRVTAAPPRRSLSLLPAIGRDQQGGALRFNF